MSAEERLAELLHRIMFDGIRDFDCDPIRAGDRRWLVWAEEAVAAGVSVPTEPGAPTDDGGGWDPLYAQQAPVPTEPGAPDLHRIVERFLADARRRGVSFGKMPDDIDTGELASDILAAVASQPVPAPEPSARLRRFLDDVEAENARAKAKFPDAGGSLAALTEEAGELAKAVLSEPPENVYAEAVQVASMAARVALEGDWTLDRYREKVGVAALAATPQDPEETR